MLDFSDAAMKKTKARKTKTEATPSAEPEPLTEDTAVAGTGGETVMNDAVQDPIAAMEAQIGRLEDALVRSKADYQNLQRRAATESIQTIRYGNAELFKGLLSVVDDFERALAAAEATENPDAVVQGVRMVYENLTKALVAQGLETIVALHQPFDPSIHEALMQQPSADHPAGTVIEEVARGYRLHDRVLRPSKVVVSKAVQEIVVDSDARGEA